MPAGRQTESHPGEVLAFSWAKADKCNAPELLHRQTGHLLTSLIMPSPLCFVLMPFGKKPEGTGLVVDFDAVYHDVIAPAVEDAGLECVRADEEQTGGIIHKPMFERL